MPTATDVLARLSAASNQLVAVAIVWHVVVSATCLALATRVVRPSVRAAMLALTAPIVSVACTAAYSGNPFNAVVFGVAALVLGALAVRSVGQLELAASHALALGVVAIAFGLWYPHFVEVRTPVEYLYSAPIGVVPCPTLALVIGFTIVAGGFGARAWSMVLASLGLVYALVGVLWLGVSLDVGLALAAAALLVTTARAPRALDAGVGVIGGWARRGVRPPSRR